VLVTKVPIKNPFLVLLIFQRTVKPRQRFQVHLPTPYSLIYPKMRFSFGCVLLFLALSSAYFDTEDYFNRRDFINYGTGLRRRDFLHHRRGIYDNTILPRYLAPLRLLARNYPSGETPPGSDYGDAPHAPGDRVPPPPWQAGTDKTQQGPGPYAAGTEQEPGRAHDPNPNSIERVNGKFKCAAVQTCAKEYGTKVDMIAHFITAHTRRGKWACGMCGTTTTTAGSMRAHRGGAGHDNGQALIRTDGSKTGDKVYIYQHLR
jgi:hypothetical protein